MVAIRLARFGTNKKPSYRIVVSDKNRPRNGKCLERVGHYDPLKKENNVTLNVERIQYWIDRGAKPSDIVKQFIQKRQRGGQS